MKCIRFVVENLKLNSLLLVLFTLLSCSEQKMQGVIDGDDIIPPEPPFWEYFTFYGVDADKDGVRDDVELWINQNYPEVNLRKALKQEARAIGRFIKSQNTKEALLRYEKKVLAASCYLFVIPFQLRRNDTQPLLLEIFNNNFLRVWNYNSVGNFLPSGIYSVSYPSKITQYEACEFKIDNLAELLKMHKNDETIRKKELEYFEKMGVL